MEQEEYIVDGHRVTHCVHLGDKEIFLAVQQDAPLPVSYTHLDVYKRQSLNGSNV